MDALCLILPNDEVKICTLKNVLHVPDLTYNLLSVSRITDSGKLVKFPDNVCRVLTPNNDQIALASKVDKLYYLKCNILFNNKLFLSSKHENDEFIWHRRFAHLGFDNLRKLVTKQMASDLDFDTSLESKACENYCDGKISRKPFSSVETCQENSPLDMIHIDVCGKFNPKSIGGGQYFSTFIAHYSSYVWVYIWSEKSQVFEKFKESKALVEKQFDKNIKVIRSDNDGEYTSNEFQNFLKKEGIKQEKSLSKTNTRRPSCYKTN